MRPGINQNFLRRGTRADLERVHIERLIGRRAPDDWLLAGSLEWLKRRDKLDLEAAQLRERLRMVDECAKWSAIPEWTEDFDCEHYCGLKFPCASCVDQILNGDEELEDCGGSCDPCPTCFDGVLNGAETGVDCGGEVCDVCVSRQPLAPLSPAPSRILCKETGSSVAQEEIADPELEPGDYQGNWADPNADPALRPEGCDAPDWRDCKIINDLTAMSGAHPENFAHPPPGYQEDSEFYPWVRGSVYYNASHWRVSALLGAWLGRRLVVDRLHSV